jgi:RNA polymerase sigma-70 factor (ECF subfamily)
MSRAASAAVPEPEPISSLSRAQAGDSTAFEAIVREHQRMVFSLAYHYTGNAATAEDLAQDVFFELSRGLARLESPEHLVFWLRRVTTNRCIDWLRRTPPVEQRRESLPERAAAHEFTDVLLEARLRTLIAELPDHARAVMVLRYQEDLDPSEIAEVLEMPLNTVKSHLRRSVDTMRARLGMKERV